MTGFFFISTVFSNLTNHTYPRMQNNHDTEAISCEPLEEGDDPRVQGADHCKEGPPGEGTSLTAANPVNVKYMISWTVCDVFVMIGMGVVYM